MIGDILKKLTITILLVLMALKSQAARECSVEAMNNGVSITLGSIPVAYSKFENLEGVLKSLLIYNSLISEGACVPKSKEGSSICNLEVSETKSNKVVLSLNDDVIGIFNGKSLTSFKVFESLVKNKTCEFTKVSCSLEPREKGLAILLGGQSLAVFKDASEALLGYKALTSLGVCEKEVEQINNYESPDLNYSHSSGVR